MYNHGARKEGKDTYLTPDWALDIVGTILSGKDWIDPCPGDMPMRVAQRGGTPNPPGVDGLGYSWRKHEASFVNPPFSDIMTWVDKAIEETSQTSHISVWFCKMDFRTQWGIKILQHAKLVMPTIGYVRFLNSDGSESDSATFQNALIVFGDLPNSFVEDLFQNHDVLSRFVTVSKLPCQELPISGRMKAQSSKNKGNNMVTKPPSLRNKHTYTSYVDALLGKSGDLYLDLVWDPNRTLFSESLIHDLWDKFGFLSEPAICDEIYKKFGFSIPSTSEFRASQELANQIGKSFLYGRVNELVAISILGAIRTKFLAGVEAQEEDPILEEITEVLLPQEVVSNETDEDFSMEDLPF